MLTRRECLAMTSAAAFAPLAFPGAGAAAGTRRRIAPSSPAHATALRGFAASDRGCLFGIRRALDGLQLRDGALDGCGVLVRSYGARLSNVVIEGITLRVRYFSGVGAGLFHVSGGWTENVLIRDFTVRGMDPITTAGDIYAAITLAGNRAGEGALGRGFLFERFTISDLPVAYAGYANRDGFAIERGFQDGIIRDGRIARVADAGIDIKGKRWMIDRVTIEDAHASIKAWCSNRFGAITSKSPRTAHVWACGDVSRAERMALTIGQLDTAGNPQTPLVHFKNRPSDVVIAAGNWPADQRLYRCDPEAAGSTLRIGNRRIL